MIYAINLLATILNASNGLVLAALVGYILFRDGIAFKNWLVLAFIYPLLQGITACTVLLNIEDPSHPAIMAISRLVLGLTGEALTVMFAIYLRDFIGFLREKHNAEKRLADERSDRLFSAEGILEIGKQANAAQDRHLILVQRQGTQVERHA